MLVDERLKIFEASLPDQTTADLKKAKKDLLQASLSGRPLNRTRAIDERIGYLINQELARRERELDNEGKEPLTEAQRLAAISKQPVEVIEAHLARKRKKEGGEIKEYVEKLSKKDKDYYEKVDKEILKVTGQPAVKKGSSNDSIH
jgi:hypothetical protein